MKRLILIATLCSLFSAASANPLSAQVRIQKGQTVYVPAYSHVFKGDKAAEHNLSITLMVRNTDFRNPITVTTVDYYDDDGKLVKKLIDRPVRIGPMATGSFFIKESDTSAGIGANFVVNWVADKALNVPVIDAVMTGIRLNQSTVFISHGQVIRE